MYGDESDAEIERKITRSDQATYNRLLERSVQEIIDATPENGKYPEDDPFPTDLVSHVRRERREIIRFMQQGKLKLKQINTFVARFGGPPMIKRITHELGDLPPLDKQHRSEWQTILKTFIENY